MESAAKIKEILQAAELEKLPDFIAAYQEDPRERRTETGCISTEKTGRIEKGKTENRESEKI